MSSVLLSVAGGVVVRCFGKAHSWVSLALIISLIVLPFGVCLPGISIAAQESTGAAQSFPWVAFLGGLWGGGVLLGFLKLVVDYLWYKAWTRKTTEISALEDQVRGVCERAQVKTPPQVRVADDISAPVIGGAFRPTLFLPPNYKGWSEETLEMVLWHEIGHMKRKDLWKQLLGQIGSALYWFNPLIANLRKTLSSHCELACDAWVMRHGISRQTYLNALCDVAETARYGERRRFSLSMADHVSLSERVKTLVDQPQRKSPLVAVALLTILTFAGLMIVSLEPKASAVSESEIELRFSADPFPLD